jgi:hypothetical protein
MDLCRLTLSSAVIALLAFRSAVAGVGDTLDTVLRSSGSSGVPNPLRFPFPSNRLLILLSSMDPSPQRQTADAIVAAFNVMDIEKIVSFRDPTCLRHIVPLTLGLKPQDNARFLAELQKLKPIFQNFCLTINDVVEDREAGRICMWLSARADTAAGEYVNEYMWTMEFDESGRKLTRIREFVDTTVNKEFWPKLVAAMNSPKS